MFIRTTRYLECFEGYIYTDTNTGLGHYVYSGFLFACDGHMPIPPAKDEEYKE
ncbi:hypothetical protein GCM10028868_37710 [Virgibacillus kimchii]